MHKVFLRSAIQATDSTLTGCTANSAAASQAPGSPSRASTRHNSTTLSACNSTFTRW